MSLLYENSAVHIAVINNQLDKIQELLKLPETERDAVNHRGETPLFLSLKNKCSDELISELIDSGCNVNIPNRKGLTPLHLAVQRRNPVIVSKLIEKGANVNAKNNHQGCTPLHTAIAQGRLRNLKELLSLNKMILIDAKNNLGQTPLVYGLCKESGNNIISTLIDAGCDITIPDNTGCTSLHYAAYRKWTLIAQKLIEKGADINIANKQGSTPLHMGVEQHNLEYVCMLLYYGASVNEIDYEGRTPFYNALSYSQKITRHLLNYVVDFNQYPYLTFALEKGLKIAVDLVDRCDVNHLYGGVHSLLTACICNSSYEILQTIWSKSDFNLFIRSLGNKDFLSIFCQFCDLPNNQFIEFLYTIFNSPYIEDFLSHRRKCKSLQSFINLVFRNRRSLCYVNASRRAFLHNESKSRWISPFEELHLDKRMEIILVLLSHGVDVYFEDVCYLYESYGFDESVELLLMNGCYIHPNEFDTDFGNLIVRQICFDNIDIYIDDWDNSNNRQIRLKGFFDKNAIRCYGKFYRTTLIPDDRYSFLIPPEISCSGEIPSLLQLSRDLIRKHIYTNLRTCYSFTVYQAISKLPIPSIIRDILFLKRPIYE